MLLGLKEQKPAKPNTCMMSHYIVYIKCVVFPAINEWVEHMSEILQDGVLDRPNSHIVTILVLLTCNYDE